MEEGRAVEEGRDAELAGDVGAAVVYESIMIRL